MSDQADDRHRRRLPGGMHAFVIDTDRRLLGVVADEQSITTHADESLAVPRREAA